MPLFPKFQQSANKCVKAEKMQKIVQRYSLEPVVQEQKSRENVDVLCLSKCSASKNAHLIHLRPSFFNIRNLYFGVSRALTHFSKRTCRYILSILFPKIGKHYFTYNILLLFEILFFRNGQSIGNDSTPVCRIFCNTSISSLSKVDIWRARKKANNENVKVNVDLRENPIKNAAYLKIPPVFWSKRKGQTRRFGSLIKVPSCKREG